MDTGVMGGGDEVEDALLPIETDATVDTLVVRLRAKEGRLKRDSTGVDMIVVSCVGGGVTSEAEDVGSEASKASFRPTCLSASSVAEAGGVRAFQRVRTPATALRNPDRVSERCRGSKGTANLYCQLQQPALNLRLLGPMPVWPARAVDQASSQSCLQRTISI